MDRVLAGYSDRACSPQETLSRVTPLFGKYDVTRLARITGLDCIGIPVWNAIRPNARSIAIHQGKGITDIDAKVSAAMEALERAVAEAPEVPAKLASRRQLASAGLVAEPLDCLIAAGQNTLDEDTVIEWIEGDDLLTGHPVWVPQEAATLDRTKQSRYWQSSDGLASGNTMEEAVFHGLLERIERDAEVLWKLDAPAKRELSCLEPTCFHDVVINDLKERIERQNFRLQLFDMTSDIGIPVISALLAPNNSLDAPAPRYIDVSHGSGAHPIAARAAIRAITEAVQSRLTLISGSRDDVPPELYSRSLPDALKRDLAFKASPQTCSDASGPNTGLGPMLEIAIEKLRMAKVGPVIAVRLNPGEENLAVAKLVVPGLENPEGARKQPFGGRAMKKMLVFR